WWRMFLGGALRRPPTGGAERVGLVHANQATPAAIAGPFLVRLTEPMTREGHAHSFDWQGKPFLFRTPGTAASGQPATHRDNYGASSATGTVPDPIAHGPDALRWLTRPDS